FDFKYNESEITRHQRRQPRYRSYERQSRGAKSAYSYRRDRRIDSREYLERKREKTRRNSGAYGRPNKTSTAVKSRNKKKSIHREIEALKSSGLEKFSEYDIEGSI